MNIDTALGFVTEAMTIIVTAALFWSSPLHLYLVAMVLAAIAAPRIGMLVAGERK